MDKRLHQSQLAHFIALRGFFIPEWTS